MLQRGETELTGKLEMETRNRKKSHENDIKEETKNIRWNKVQEKEVK